MRTETKLPVTIRRVVLTGFMGAGKSTIGALLAAKLGWRFLDSDAEIEARAGATIAQLFGRHGEAAFRVLEMETILDHAQAEHIVLALGGGAVEAEPTRRALGRLEEACIIFLDAPLEVMIARCIAQPAAAERPVLADREGLAARLAARLPHYRRAHLTVPTAELSPEAVVSQILQALRERFAVLPVTPHEKEGVANR
jgi:shikimate kinase